MDDTRQSRRNTNATLALSSSGAKARKLAIKLPRELHRRLRHLCVAKDTSMQAYLVMLIAWDLQRQDLGLPRSG